ncbi:pseudouridine synthase [Xylaria palmicola]|nr:pseudouridine synthase [Xylaria palmicola]
MATHTAMAQGSNALMRSSLEQRLGIIHFVSAKEHGWSGQSRTRFTDFQVNEITKDGVVVHLREFYRNARELAQATSQDGAGPSGTEKLSQPSQPSQPGEIAKTASEDITINSQHDESEEKPSTQNAELPGGGISETDKTILVDLLGQKTADELILFYTQIQQNAKSASNSQGNVNIPTIEDKAQRSRIHGEIRRIFGGKIDTTTGSDGSIKATNACKSNRKRGNRSANNGPRRNRQNSSLANSGPYLHFSLYKENKDTMDALNHMAKTLKIHPKAFGAAGTKDRRAVTVQRVSVKGRTPASLLFVNERINSVKIGDFKYAQDPIRLNDHEGNEFVIVLKNCVFTGTENLNFEEKLSVARSTIDSALTQLIQRGFINYYGTQRFGTHQIGTQEIGMKILKEDFAGAVQALLSYDQLLLRDLGDQSQDHLKGAHREDINRARACSTFLETKNSKAALDYLPPRCHVEKTLIQHLGKNPTDFVGALMSINRSMRTMYGHAYQSLVWNFVASKRWERFGTQVINGDLVLVKSKSAATLRADDDEKDSAEGFVWGEDLNTTQSSGFVPHAVTEDDLQDRKYSIYDVVLPSPGWDVIYPSNEIGDYYAEFMGKPENGGLDPYNMHRRQRDFSLPGSYRKLMGKLERVPTASVQVYSNDLEQLVPTDLDIIQSRKAQEAKEHDSRQQSAAASWHTFTQTISQKELEESKARGVRREAEDPIPSARVNDTWIQTSMDGSNKRIKIAKHANVTASDTKPIGMGGDTMEVIAGTKSEEPGNADIDATVVNQPNEVDQANNQQPAKKSVGSSIIAAVVAQPTPRDPPSEPCATSPQPASTNDGATNAVDKNYPIPQTTSMPSKDTTHVSPSTQLPSAPEDLQIGSTLAAHTILTTELAEPTKTGATVSTDSIDPKKIAVILRFALETSQYATIVVRELQGAPLANSNFA